MAILTCPHCGAAISTEIGSTFAHCEYCGCDMPVEPNMQTPTAQPTHQQISYPATYQSQYQPQYQNPYNIDPITQTEITQIQKWKQSMKRYHIITALSTALFLAMILADSNSDLAVFPFLISCGYTLVSPVILAVKRPNDLLPKKRNMVANIFLYYLAFIGNVMASFFVTTIVIGTFL